MKILKDINFVIVTLLLAVFLPLMTDTVFSESKDTARIYYSETLDKFLLQGYDRQKKEPFFKIGLDQNISLDEFMENLPFKFYSYLLSKNLFPKELSEWANDDKIMENSQNLNIKPDMFNQKQVPIFTIFESKPKYLKLKFNEFGIRNAKEGLEFISFDTLKIDANISQRYTNALKELEFQFPFKEAYSNPNTKKPFDEGVFLIDDKYEVYHLKMVQNSPVVVRTGIKNDSISFILMAENPRKEFYGALIDRDGVKLISYDKYQLIDLVSENYDPKSSKFQLAITPLSKTVTIENEGNTTVYKLDNKYKVLDKFEYTFSGNESYENAKKTFFAFEIKQEPSYAYKLNFSDFSKNALFLNLVLFIVFLMINFKRNRSIFRALVVLLTGIYGFIAALIA